MSAPGQAVLEFAVFAFAVPLALLAAWSLFKSVIG